LSFSVAEDSLLTWGGINEPIEGDWTRDAELVTQLHAQNITSEDSKGVRRRILDTEALIGDWVAREVAGLQYLDDLIDEDQEALNGLYRPRVEEYQGLRTESIDKLGFEKSQLAEGIKEIEVLGAKWEYEINALRSKVEDVEDGVTEFERQVNTVEDRVTELEYDMRSKESWLHWIIRLTTGLGKAPATNTTQTG
jgi:chromosome segregation ATPase